MLIHKERLQKKIHYILTIVTTVIVISVAQTFYVEASENSNLNDYLLEARTELQSILDDQIVMALVYLCDEFTMYTEPSYDSSTDHTVYSGQQVQIQEVCLDDGGEVWVAVKYYLQSETYYGYIPRYYLACSDELYLEWENKYGFNMSTMLMTLDENGETVYPDIEAFPDSYRTALTALKKSHPNWTFVKLNTGLDWTASVNAEMQGGRSLVPNSYADYMKEGTYGTGGWSYAASNILSYYMDPRNALTEDKIFQFELLTYNESYHTEAAVQSFLNNTFMSGTAPGTVMTFSHIFWAIGSEAVREGTGPGVSPFHLACRVYQEQGAGTSPLISGTYSGYEGYYNYFNIGATGSTNQAVIESGLTYARNNGWNNAYNSILGGAQFISANYILKGQDTLYLQKFNVNPGSSYGVYNHQYMQNIVAPTSECQNVKKLYQTANSLDNTFVFKIPVYNNMPDTAVLYPTASNDVILTPPTGFTDATIYMDGIAYPAETRNGKLVATAKDSNAKTAVMYQYDDGGIPRNMYVWELSYSKGAYTATAVTGLENLLSYHGFSIRITGNSGIRMKTGIDASVRANLLANGINGYKLKEYGTVYMMEQNMSEYPLIKGGTKTSSVVAYGYDTTGAFKDAIFETKSNRYRYTLVLYNIPVKYFKSNMAFRAYAVLTKNGQDVVIYGPIMSRNIYALAEQTLDLGLYETGTAPEQFLQSIITEADALETEAMN